MSSYAYSSRRASGQNRRGGSSRRPSSSGGKRGMKKDYIHPSKFVRPAKPVAEEQYVPENTFADFEIHEVLKKNVAAKGYETPSPIQDQTIPYGLKGFDVIGLANTGTGKTAAFLLPVLHRLMINKDTSKALIVAPTRELAQQIEQEIREIAKGSGLFGTLLIGGSSMGQQLRDLRQGVDVVVGTPGRIKDHIDRGTLNLQAFDLVVLDEVDRMLDMGFVNDVREILSQLSEDRQSFFFSATLDRRVSDLIQTFANESAVTISVKTGDTSDNVNQDIVCYESMHDKIEQLHNILIREDVGKVIVFDETQRSVERLSQELQQRGFKADDIHGGKTQGARKRSLDNFKRNHVNILVATDVAARGIDVADVTHVINYSLPNNYSDYTHRIGRAGRAGKVGYALTFVTER